MHSIIYFAISFQCQKFKGQYQEVNVLVPYPENAANGQTWLCVSFIAQQYSLSNVKVTRCRSSDELSRLIASNAAVVQKPLQKYTVSQKNMSLCIVFSHVKYTVLYRISYNFGKCPPIFLIFSLLDSAANLQHIFITFQSRTHFKCERILKINRHFASYAWRLQWYLLTHKCRPYRHDMRPSLKIVLPVTCSWCG